MKFGALDECISSFLKVLSSCSEVKGVHKDSVSLLTVTWSVSFASRCVENLMPILQAEVPDEVNRPFSQEARADVSVCHLCGALGVVTCREPSF